MLNQEWNGKARASPHRRSRNHLQVQWVQTFPSTGVPGKHLTPGKGKFAQKNSANGIGAKPMPAAWVVEFFFRTANLSLVDSFEILDFGP